MTRPYFRQIPNFEYVNRNPDSVEISDYIPVKNLFKRGEIRPDILENLSFFTKYKVIGDERPDNVAYNFYGDETLDWIILLSNNILNIQSEWPLPQTTFDQVLLEKYGSYEELYSGIHHYETLPIVNSLGVTILPGGIKTTNTWETNGNFIKNGNSYYYEYYDSELSNFVTLSIEKVITSVTNYEYESKIEDDKRNIFILKPQYLNIVFNDMDKIMPYKQGAAQYIDRTLKRGDNIRLFN